MSKEIINRKNISFLFELNQTISVYVKPFSIPFEADEVVVKTVTYGIDVAETLYPTLVFCDIIKENSEPFCVFNYTATATTYCPQSNFLLRKPLPLSATFTITNLQKSTNHTRDGELIISCDFVKYK